MSLRDVVAKRKAERDRPKTLAELRAARKPKPAAVEVPSRPRTLAEIKEAKFSAKQDFHRGGLLYHNVRAVNGYWMIDVTNNDVTYTMHNRYGSWMHSVNGREGWMKEPAWVALALGTSVTQIDMAQSLIARLEIEMKARGIPTHEELLRQREEATKAERRKRRNKAEDPQD